MRDEEEGKKTHFEEGSADDGSEVSTRVVDILRHDGKDAAILVGSRGVCEEKRRSN